MFDFAEFKTFLTVLPLSLLFVHSVNRSTPRLSDSDLKTPTQPSTQNFFLKIIRLYVKSQDPFKMSFKFKIDRDDHF